MGPYRRYAALAGGILVVQVVGASVFILELFSDVLGLRHWALDWQAREAVQLGAVLSLVLGAIAGIAFLLETVKRAASVETQLQAASGAFQAAMRTQFGQWGLSPAEEEVALFALKGFSNQEIAELRGKSEATVKTQMNAVFRKAGVNNRSQLMAQFMELLLDEPRH
ncbi:helix-turn-helix transcriptional regulator [Maritimibacter sp. DP07]|uniref:Helix-turn-helix transcriptional regulator n=1 Tax=Maritimibacter harenae TaxID=2606218 RepID=A0A845LZD0_9RHOB|nr:LuxR C-terminal-related transcriptional regulator [Maritimibacter harenae]MZR12202.1 helix-turn-helix transcriptional regulator [Maritimibacter harenae]